ncbi:Hypothetical predicted protein [Olea europaea subsp. europaea]|uniref:Uncharacterized protein n=1 Tax=Olea europaea subsp. europaea TaxID=158383 RepID=A0A8S0PJG1_OLEEU|nr:Hypothetical predicted protein [Olea europaea subsp. europaea]
MKGAYVEAPLGVLEEESQYRRALPLIWVEKRFEDVRAKLSGRPEFLLCLLPKRKKRKLSGPPKFLLCLLPERKNCDIYGPRKGEILVDFA